ncbi:L-lysine exporter family protein LysE/ArgO [Microbacterium sp. AK009]|uniref:LysE/ArgO family amino acid transporter n=1 Tax=Microbacterium sp. AK009 TaxID=2723068 RepID=UPI0015CCD3AD|nr:LysE/ArgO family amino acid transporter [Microbacterium sp. AK009]NYF17720.1 L-lysine exporter family protein LysE/ArgO [Microbacterium sp. AK009]
MTLPLFAGLGLGFSLIIAIGAQNLFVLRQGLRREHVIIVAALCALSDAVLIAVGVSGIGLVLQAVPWLVSAIRWTGAAFLIGYGVLAARRAWRPSGRALTVREEKDATGRSAGAGGVATASRTRLLPVILTTLALTWLNPHVYLDTVFLLGSVANTHGDARWVFATGAMAASVIWFFGLAFGARYLGRWLSSARSWRILDAVIAVVMIALGVSLVLPH